MKSIVKSTQPSHEIFFIHHPAPWGILGCLCAVKGQWDFDTLDTTWYWLWSKPRRNLRFCVGIATRGADPSVWFRQGILFLRYIYMLNMIIIIYIYMLNMILYIYVCFIYIYTSYLFLRNFCEVHINFWWDPCWDSWY